MCTSLDSRRILVACKELVVALRYLAPLYRHVLSFFFVIIKVLGRGLAAILLWRCSLSTSFGVLLVFVIFVARHAFLNSWRAIFRGGALRSAGSVILGALG